jgi:uncharacterized protein (DUF4415 family)
MTGFKRTTTPTTTILASHEMRAARRRHETQSDWEMVRQRAHADPTIARQDQHIGELIARKRGRPAGQRPLKQPTTIRFDADVLAALRSTGKGWQTRVNDAMREWVRIHLGR